MSDVKEATIIISYCFERDLKKIEIEVIKQMYDKGAHLKHIVKAYGIMMEYIGKESKEKNYPGALKYMHSIIQDWDYHGKLDNPGERHSEEG